MNVQGQLGIYKEDYYPQNNVSRQSSAAGMQDVAPDANKYEDKVIISDRTVSHRTTPSGMPAARFEVFGGPNTMLPPEGAGPIEEWAYRREGIHMDTSSTPPRFKDTGNPISYQEWLAMEKEIDKFVAKRVDIYNTSKAEGLSDDEIYQRLKDFNSTIPSKYFGIGEPYQDGFRVDYGGSPPPVANIDAQRRKSYEMMTNYLANS